jgi:putative nucleotidyltransferase with HDIG domain
MGDARAAEFLSPPLLRLFQRLGKAEGRHALDVALALEKQGYRDPNLLSAALLHDVGKTVAPPRLWERVAVVLGEHFLPRHAARWAGGAPRGWRRPFVVHHRHAVWGAEMARGAGATPRTVALIRRHHAPPQGDEELAALQAVDDGRMEEVQ